MKIEYNMTPSAWGLNNSVINDYFNLCAYEGELFTKYAHNTYTQKVWERFFRKFLVELFDSAKKEYREKFIYSSFRFPFYKKIKSKRLWGKITNFTTVREFRTIPNAYNLSRRKTTAPVSCPEAFKGSPQSVEREWGWEYLVIYTQRRSVFAVECVDGGFKLNIHSVILNPEQTPFRLENRAEYRVVANDSHGYVKTPYFKG